MSNSKEPVGGRLLLLALPLVCSLPFLLITFNDGLSLFEGAGIVVLVLVMVIGACFFFPEPTIIRVVLWRQRRARFRLGVLNYNDATWLAERYTPTPVPPNRYGDAFSVSLAGMIYTQVTESHLVEFEAGDMRMGRAVVRWLRKGHDPVLLLDALVADLSAVELESHLDGRAPLDPEAVAMLAGLQPHRKSTPQP